MRTLSHREKIVNSFIARPRGKIVIYLNQKQIGPLISRIDIRIRHQSKHLFHEEKGTQYSHRHRAADVHKRTTRRYPVARGLRPNYIGFNVLYAQTEL